MKEELTKKLIAEIHPDDYPEDSQVLFRMVRVVSSMTKEELVRKLKLRLADEMIEAGLPESAVMAALELPPIAALWLKDRGPVAPVKTKPVGTLARIKEKYAATWDVPAKTRRKKHEHCTFRDCNSRHAAKGFCQYHYVQYRTKGVEGMGKGYGHRNGKKPTPMIAFSVECGNGKLSNKDQKVADAYGREDA